MYQPTLPKLFIGVPAAVLLTAGVAIHDVAAASVDLDADGLSDVWELRFGATALAPQTDTDGDGLSNLSESLLGTDPFDSSSRLSSFPSPGEGRSLALNWSPLPQALHHVETSTDLQNWTRRGTYAAGTGRHIESLPETGPFYMRLTAEQPDTDADGVSDWEESVAGYNPSRKFTEGLGNPSANPANYQADLERIRASLSAPTNTLSLSLQHSHLEESWPRPGIVRIQRTGRLDELKVKFATGGSATAGVDYSLSHAGEVLLPFGASEAHLWVIPHADAISEGEETLEVSLLAGAGYTLAAPTVASLRIREQSPGRPSAPEAVRFLQQASFGATQAELDRVTDLGISGWIEDQFNRPVGYHLPKVLDWQEELGGGAGNRVTPDQRVEVWWRKTMDDSIGGDPLRQRVAFALSQIFVVSDRNSAIGDDPRSLAGYQDMLLEHAFGNVRELLEAVTRHPVMGLYLSHLRNRKADPSVNRFPDENYAREILQLFSIGLWRLNPDGSRVLSNGGDLGPEGVPVALGQPIPTYSEDQIAVFARVFTGLSYGSRFVDSTDTTIQPATRFRDSLNVSWLPMRMFDAEHDLNPKTLWFPGLSARVLPQRVASSPDTGSAGDQDLGAALDYLFSHPNVGPFLGRLLIQRLVTSNPSPAYVARVSAAFAGSETSPRGDMRSLLRAILLDPEARSYASTLDPRGGLVREPYTRYVALARALNVRPDPSSDGRFRGFGSLRDEFLQRPYSSLSVFNFYSPDYSPPGPMKDLGLVAPEMQITNSFTSIAGANRFSSALAVTGSTATNTTQFNFSQQTPATNNSRADEAAWLEIASGAPERLVERLNTLLCADRMTPWTFRAITRSLARTPDPLAPGISDADKSSRAALRFRIAAHFTAICPEGSTLR